MDIKAVWIDKALDYIYYSGAFACILSVVKYMNGCFKKEHENETITEQGKIIKELMKQLKDTERELARVVGLLENSK